MAPSRSNNNTISSARLDIPTLSPLYSSIIFSSSTSDLDSSLLPRDLYAQAIDRPSSSRSLPPSQYRKNMKDLTGFDTTEDEFEALPLAYFSTLERLRFAERANSLALNELPIQRPRKKSIADRRNAPVIELRRRPSSRKLRKQSTSSNDASWFLNLPPKVKRKNFSREERVILDGRLQDKIILDAADEAVLKHRLSRVLPPLDPKLDSPGPYSSQSSLSIRNQKAEESGMAEAMYDSFRWMDEESDLDLRLVLDDYHANLDGVVIPSPTSNRRPSFRRQMSISKIPFGRSSLSSLHPRTPKTEQPPPIHNRQKSRTLSLIAPKHMVHNSVSSIDPNATHYQDPEARLKLRVYLASPQKFDEAIEFGFPSMDGVTAGADKENKPPMRSSRDTTEIKRSFATDGGRSFLDDAASLFEDDISMADPDSPITPLGVDPGFTPEPRSSISAYGTKSSKTSVDYSHLGITKPTLVKQPDGYAQAMAGSREMTLRMTLTRPDLRADEKTIYGWQATKVPLRDESLAMDDLEEKQEVKGPYGGADGWGPAEKESVVSVFDTLSSGQAPGPKKDAPGVKTNSFSFIPYNVNYFEDSDVILFENGIEHNVQRSDDAGETWHPVKDVPEGKMLELVMHPFDNKRAYIITNGRSHWKTSDRGQSWQEFKTDAMASIFREALAFHATDPDRIIFNAMDCTGIFCEELTLYTTDGFSKSAKFLRSDTMGCYWAKSSKKFETGQKDLDANRILCVVKGRFSPWRKDYRLVISDDFFVKAGDVVQEFEPALEAGRPVKGIVNMAVVTKYLIAAASAEGTDEMALYVSDDAIKWHRAIFPKDHKLPEKAYTILESTDYSIQIDVQVSKPSQPMGVFLSSNSNGTYFTRNMEHTNRNKWGLVDFEKISGVQGIVLVNTVKNWEEVEETTNKEKKVISQISFDDGRTFEDLKCEEKILHLHSVTDLSNSGRVFSSPAPGLVMGIGNTGDHLEPYSEGSLYISDDAGLTWTEGLKGPHKYEFGDQGSILVAIKDELTDEFWYSLNHGKKWDKVSLDEKIRPVQLTTTQDSTSLKFLLEAVDQKEPSVSGYIIAIDFDDMHERQCTKDDMEDWYARLDEDNQPTCIMGHKQMYSRRKGDRDDCFLKKEFENPEPKSDPCDCTDADFECDYNFVRSPDRKTCDTTGAFHAPDDVCKDAGPDGTFKGSSGWRLIPGNKCKRTPGAQKDDLVERKCSESDNPYNPSSGKIDHTLKEFKGNMFLQKVYLERTGVSTGSDETVLVRIDNNVYLSNDHGKTWEPILEKQHITRIYPHPHFNDVVFFLTQTEEVWYSVDRGKNLRSFKADYPPTTDVNVPVMNFHWKYKDWIIWTGMKGCDTSDGCHNVALLSEDRGEHWRTLRRYVRRCEFVKEEQRLYLTPAEEMGKKAEKEKLEKLIYCEVRTKEQNDPKDNPWRLVSSEDFFTADPEEHFTNVVNFATMSEFIVVATKNEARQTLQVNASIDGHHFAPAHFPHGVEVPHQEAYTVLDSSTHSVFLHVTVNNKKDLEYGTIIKSNSNGTSYVQSLPGVDRDGIGYVDFEKTFGLEGVAMVNVVANYESENYEAEGKRLKTMITHNDGAEWAYLPPPSLDADRKEFGCKGDLAKCSLNIHGYTERTDKSHTYSSSSAIGLMLATGNVGEYLSKESDTFMTNDGGISWMQVKKGKYMWEYGDQGSIVVIVRDGSPTNLVYYSFDEGENWDEYKFSEKEVKIDDMTTVPSDNARNFLLWGSDDGNLVTYNLDFSGLTDVQCKLDEKNPEAGDYYLWTPKHPNQDTECLFGHISQYHRKDRKKVCYNGKVTPGLHEITENCTCTRRDYECDFNFERQTDGSCGLVAGYMPADHSLICEVEPDTVEYFEPTGYRRIPVTTCEGGTQFDINDKPKPCPGKGDQFNKKHGPSAASIFFAITIPIAVAMGVGYWVWRNWASKFGQIRLGEQSSFDGEAPYIKYPVLVVAGIAAVAQALPLLASSLWRSASTAIGRGPSRRFTTRDSFARGRGDYAIVDEDEGELLGDESDEEV
ncbi:hypothetical protein G7Y89_g9863 [Cudoniella acicularis]|uniref:Vacuolar protein sorting/targeting protein 10 n=1 Tax=Cudoniella acicularis TaxID=354080 RepID=A0A8H4VZQ6_9HELO|nr:hypothetical protein G7Y89_g9863 [Cudoniella acicularis]